MNMVVSQLFQWPPTSTTVIGVGLLVGAMSYAATGSVEWAVVLAGAFKMLCPQDAPVTDHVLDALSKLPVHKIALGAALCASLGLAACTPDQLTRAQSYQDKLAGLCAVASPLAPLAGPYGVWITGACSSEAMIAKLALDPSSQAWLVDLIDKAKAFRG